MSAEFFIVLIATYLLGSVNSAIIYCKLWRLPDPRTKGSLNPGATNVYRIAGKSAAVQILLFDILKGIIPSWGSYYLGFSTIEIGAISIACCIGHMFPVYFRFQGGKAVATALGCLLPVGSTLAFTLLGTWMVVFRLTGYSSLAAIVAVGISPLITHLTSPKYTIAVSMLAILIIARHIPNIIRLLNGNEPKSNLRVK